MRYIETTCILHTYCIFGPANLQHVQDQEEIEKGTAGPAAAKDIKVDFLGRKDVLLYFQLALAGVTV